MNFTVFCGIPFIEYSSSRLCAFCASASAPRFASADDQWPVWSPRPCCILFFDDTIPARHQTACSLSELHTVICSQLAWLLRLFIQLTFELFLELLVGRFGRGPQCRIFATKIFCSTNFFLEKFAKSSNRVRAHRPKVRPKVRRVEFPKSPKSGQLRTNDCTYYSCELVATSPFPLGRELQ